MLRYVFSAPHMLRLQRYVWEDDHSEEANKYKTVVTECIKKIRDDIKHIDGNITLSVDVLYNAFTEAVIGPRLWENENFGFDKVYADSGGLQIVTANKTIDDSLKEKIYNNQSYADYAMCFDEIPVRNVEGIAINSGVNRATVSNKNYFPELLQQCAVKTASNIREQIEVFDKIGAKTKVFYIIQGNTYDDMVEWFRHGSKVLDKEHFNKISGLSLADTCIGNGELESIDMLVAYYKIRNEFVENLTKNHVHLLGVGGISRFLPILYLIKSGLLDEKLTISFDSSSLSLSYMLGRFTDSDGNKIDPGCKVRYRGMFDKFFDYFDEIFNKHFSNYDREKTTSYLVDNIRSIGDTLANIESINGRYDYDTLALIRSIIAAVIVWQVVGYSRKIKEIMDNSSFDNSPIGLLQYVKDFDDYKSWYRENHHRVSSKRIRRKQNNIIDKWFE